MEKKRKNLRFVVISGKQNETEEVPSFPQNLNKVRERGIQVDQKQRIYQIYRQNIQDTPEK